jgi:hypothetical protein
VDSTDGLAVGIAGLAAAFHTGHVGCRPDHPFLSKCVNLGRLHRFIFL